MTLKKINELAKKFQVKLAQSGLAGDPLDWAAAKRDLGAITDVKEYDKMKPKTQPKAHLDMAVPVSDTQNKKPELTADLKSKLDIGAPGLKGMILLTPNPTNPKQIRVDYNADRWTHGANAIKTVLTNALPGYTITDLYGHMNPAWTPNYF